WVSAATCRLPLVQLLIIEPSAAPYIALYSTWPASVNASCTWRMALIFCLTIGGGPTAGAIPTVGVVPTVGSVGTVGMVTLGARGVLSGRVFGSCSGFAGA